MTQTDTENKKPRMESVHPFKFNCSPGVSCFTQCCRDITIVLTPYDILRMKNNLNISSDDFLDRYTLIIPKEKLLIPLVILKMNEEDKRCPFVSKTGCTIYSDRPWPCRMYPLNINDDGTYSVIANNSKCLGLNEGEMNKISVWLDSQKIGIYDEMNEYLTSLTIQLQSQDLNINNPKIHKMIIMSLYNIDKFRDFIFKSTFLERFEVKPEVIEGIENDDVELLKFGFEWIKFGVFGKKVFWIKEKRTTT